MTYPEENDFIPYNLALIGNKPIPVRDDESAKVWFKFDDRFKQPKVFIRLLIETPLVYDTVDHLAQSKLYELALSEGLNEITYPISLAGLSYNLGIEKRGLTLSVGGYSERTIDLLRLVAKNLKQIRIDEEKFQNLKEAIIRSMENRKLGQSYSRAALIDSRSPAAAWSSKALHSEGPETDPASAHCHAVARRSREKSTPALCILLVRACDLVPGCESGASLPVRR